MAVLIVTMPYDADAHVVKLAINELGERCDLFYPVDFAGGAEWSFDPDAAALTTDFRGNSEALSFHDYRAVWMRRPCASVPREHLGDVRERIAAESDSAAFVNSMLRSIELGKFVANRLGPTRNCEDKPYQFRLARDVGLPMPATIISNSPQTILDFYRRWNGQIVYKPLRVMVWDVGNATYNIVRTTVIDDPELLSSSDLRSAPGIYQQLIEKQAEVRVTVLGRSVLALEKRFPTRGAADLNVDWRAMHTGAQYRRHQLPDSIIEQCYLLLGRLGMVMGVFDFMIDARGNYYFLEVNPQGQFLCGDQVCLDLNHLEAIAQFLLSADPEFRYEEAGRIRLSQFSDPTIYERLFEHERKHHFGDMFSFRYGALAVRLAEFGPLRHPIEQAGGGVETPHAAGA